MATPHSFSLFLITISFFILTPHSSAFSSSSIASDQLKFWSENVQNPMPNSILKKLSPLTKKDSVYYTSILSTSDKFTADTKFCSLANLACTSVFASSARTVILIYQTPSAAHPASNKNADTFSFFRQSVLTKDNLLHLPNVQESLPNRAFLPSQIASKIPLTYEYITKMFPQASSKKTVQDALSYCKVAAIEGETKGCPKSLEEMVVFAKSALGANKLRALTSKIDSKGSSSGMVIKKMKQYPAKKIVACHEASLPFAAYFCHSIPSTRLYEVELVDPKKESGYVNTMLGMCHMDTSAWPKNHVAFQMLKFGPGEGEACHWFTYLDLAWISDESV
ncbi:hypothetical protein ACS0TY_023407 [Phlomoides rotata]